MKIKYSIIIPAFNEEATIAKVIALVKKNKYPGKIEIIVVDDGSIDSTAKIVKKIKGVKFFQNKENKGKGHAVMYGFKHAKGEYLIIQDADLEYHPKDHLKLIKVIEKQKLNVLYGSRFMDEPSLFSKKGIIGFLSKDNKNIRHRYQLFYLGNKFLSLLTSILYKQNITDIATCYKVFKREIILDMDIRSHGFGIEAEVTCKLLNRGVKIIELPISYKSRSYLEGKKVTALDGVKWIYIIFKHKLFKII